MVGVVQLSTVVGKSLERRVVEDVVDTHGLSTTEGVHESAAALLESVNHIAQHGVIDKRVGDVVEVAAHDAGLL